MSYRKWTSEDKEFIKNNVSNMSDDELALRLSQLNNANISVAMVRTQRRRLGIKKNRGRLSKKSGLSINFANAQPVNCFEKN